MTHLAASTPVLEALFAASRDGGHLGPAANWPGDSEKVPAGLRRATPKSQQGSQLLNRLLPAECTETPVFLFIPCGITSPAAVALVCAQTAAISVGRTLLLSLSEADTNPEIVTDVFVPGLYHLGIDNNLSTQFGCNRSSTKQIIAALRRQFRCLIIATGPIDSSSTHVSIAALSTATVLVAEARISDIAVIRDCIQRLRDAKVTLSGAVLTNYSGSSPPWAGRAPAP